MTKPHLAPLTAWLTEPLSNEVTQAIERLRRLNDVKHIALMPDIHLAKVVCVGAVIATQRLVYPAAVGGDIGCGMAALAFHAEATVIGNERAATKVMAGLYEHIPANKHRKPRELPDCLRKSPLSDTRLWRLAEREGRVQLGTLGRGNHFLEFQADHDGRLWGMVHSGSRAMGQAVLKCHLMGSQPEAAGLKGLDTHQAPGKAYLTDVEWARSYARENRLAMLVAVEQLLQDFFGVRADWDSLIHSDHNHVQQELHEGAILWVHRKGAQSATIDELGIIPGSMGTSSFHTSGRGCTAALHSCSHGAGRRLSRSEARQNVSGKAFAQQVRGLWYDHRRVDKFRDEAPAAYKNIRAVMRAQRDLTRIVRDLRPILNYKA